MPAMAIERQHQLDVPEGPEHEEPVGLARGAPEAAANEDEQQRHDGERRERRDQERGPGNDPVREHEDDAPGGAEVQGEEEVDPPGMRGRIRRRSVAIGAVAAMELMIRPFK